MYNLITSENESKYSITAFFLPVFLLFECYLTNLRISLVTQMVKNPPAMQETWVRSLGWENPLEEGMATHSSILAWRIPMYRGAWLATVRGHKESDTTEQLSMDYFKNLQLKLSASLPQLILLTKLFPKVDPPKSWV